MVQQVADHLLAAGADRVVQERAAPLVTVHEVTPSSVQLLELRAGGRTKLGCLETTLLPTTEMPLQLTQAPGSLEVYGGLLGVQGRDTGHLSSQVPLDSLGALKPVVPLRLAPFSVLGTDGLS